MTKDAIESLDALHRLNLQTGISVETLSALRGVAKESGTDLDTVAGMVNKLEKNMLTFAQIAGALLIAGCAGFDRSNQVNYWTPYTSPGSALPSTSALVNYCDEKDESGLCKKWHYPGDEIRPMAKP
jgi:hypothetical protein